MQGYNRVDVNKSEPKSRGGPILFVLLNIIRGLFGPMVGAFLDTCVGIFGLIDVADFLEAV